MRKIMLAAAVLGCALVAGCTEEQKDDAFAIACTAVSTADAGFQLYASTGKVRDSVIEGEKAAVVAAQAICDGPRPVDVKTALAAVNNALAAISVATSQAREAALK